MSSAAAELQIIEGKLRTINMSPFRFPLHLDIQNSFAVHSLDKALKF